VFWSRHLREEISADSDGGRTLGNLPDTAIYHRAMPRDERGTGAVVAPKRRLFLVARRLLSALRYTWIVLGLTIGLFLLMEGAYRMQAAVRRTLRGDIAPVALSASPNHPNAREPWWIDLTKNGDRAEGGGLRYDPFRGWWPRPERARYMNIDTEGRRVTVQPSRAPGSSTRQVYMFGGSTMWGWFVRDSFTIPSLTASLLSRLGYADIDVVNLSQTTFDLAQNAATLHQELRKGRIPAVAVFLDGNNEVAPVFQSGVMGRILNEELIARRFERRLGLRDDLLALLQHSALVRRLTQREPRAPDRERIRLCDEVAGSYARQAHALSAVAEAFRFQALFFWQPMRATTNKPLSAWERGTSRNEVWREMVRRCTAATDSALASESSVAYYPLHGIFDRDSGDVFTDDFGHLTERGNGVIATRIAALVAERLGPSRARSPR
jgi:hypothetical protein